MDFVLFCMFTCEYVNMRKSNREKAFREVGAFV